MGRRHRTYSSGSTTTTTSTSTTTTTTSSSSMGGGGMGGSACYVYPIRPAEVPTLDPNPDVVFDVGIDMNIPLTLDDGRSVTMWGFTDNGGNMASGGGGGGMGGGTFPSPAMRVRQGQLVHTQLTVGMMMYHTIHHHGIEPEYRSDGVGHITWDVNGTYTYQWRPAQAGTFFYHCHTNTVLHAEMGMYGAIIVDPPEGPGTAFHNGPTYDVEAIWAVDDIDSSWHTLDWTAGT